MPKVLPPPMRFFCKTHHNSRAQNTSLSMYFPRFFNNTAIREVVHVSLIILGKNDKQRKYSDWKNDKQRKYSKYSKLWLVAYPFKKKHARTFKSSTRKQCSACIFWPLEKKCSFPRMHSEGFRFTLGVWPWGGIAWHCFAVGNRSKLSPVVRGHAKC